jgi:hypothetical protein
VKPKTVVIVGNAKYIGNLDLHKLDGIETIGCNGILQHKYFRPSRLVIADRRAYIGELRSGRLASWATTGDILLSDTIWNRKISCGNTPVQRKPRFKHEEFHVGAARDKLNWTSTKKTICSCANTGLALFQFARIFGATRIGVTGVGLVPPREDQEGHFYGLDAWGQQESPKRAYEAAERIRDELKKKGVEVFNLSLEKAAMEKLFGRYDFDKFCEETKR